MEPKKSSRCHFIRSRPFDVTRTKSVIFTADHAAIFCFASPYQSSTKRQHEEGDLATATAATAVTAAAAGAVTRPGSPGGAGTVVALTGAARRRQMVAGDRAPLHPIRTISHHHTVRNPPGGTSSPTKPTPGSPSSSPPRRERVQKGCVLSPMERFRVGVMGVGATRAFSTTLGGAKGARCAAVVGGGGAGTGPAVGSAQEETIVSARKVRIMITPVPSDTMYVLQTSEECGWVGGWTASG